MAQITQETLNSIMELYHSGKLEEAEAKVKELLSESPNEIPILNILKKIFPIIFQELYL